MTLHEIGQHIRHARKQRHLTQQHLSERLGMSRATLSAIENGKITEIGIRKLIALCTLLGLELRVQPLTARRPTLHTLIDEANTPQKRST